MVANRVTIAGQHIADHQEHKTDVSRRAEAWCGKANILWDTPGLGKPRRALDSVGLRLGMSGVQGCAACYAAW
ncbi:hypothetical protein AB0305_09515 [Arthrobacter sp. NPDC080086]|uniref:hypothetical protein n=1 Tax=Arthrobacter sp. NPDC080086 TaxID=3155917 RepID=UPI00344F1860